MSKKKQQSYGDMAQSIEKMRAAMEKEKERMAGVMVKALLTDQTAVKLGNCTDAELKRVMSMLAGHVDECLAALEADRRTRKDRAVLAETQQ